MIDCADSSLAVTINDDEMPLGPTKQWVDEIKVEGFYEIDPVFPLRRNRKTAYVHGLLLKSSTHELELDTIAVEFALYDIGDLESNDWY
jgi:hypothetical protein